MNLKMWKCRIVLIDRASELIEWEANGKFFELFVSGKNWK